MICDEELVLETGETIWQRMNYTPSDDEVQEVLDLVQSQDPEINVLVSDCEGVYNLISWYGVNTVLNRLAIRNINNETRPIETCPRDEYDDYEQLTKISIDHGKLKKFAKWWKKNAYIKFIPVVPVNPDAVAADAVEKIVAIRRKKIKKDKEHRLSTPLDLFKWHYLEGTHGKSYSLSGIGEHHKAGDKRSFTISLKPEVTFKIFGQEVEMSSSGASYTAEHTHKDVELGGNLIYYCDDIANKGTKYGSGSIFETWVREDN